MNFIHYYTTTIYFHGRTFLKEKKINHLIELISNDVGLIATPITKDISSLLFFTIKAKLDLLL